MQRPHRTQRHLMIYGYVWLTLELAKQLERMTDLMRMALRK